MKSPRAVIQEPDQDYSISLSSDEDPPTIHHHRIETKKLPDGIQSEDRLEFDSGVMGAGCAPFAANVCDGPVEQPSATRKRAAPSSVSDGGRAKKSISAHTMKRRLSGLLHTHYSRRQET